MDCKKSCSIGCSCIGLIISTVFAAAVGVLFFFHLIPNIVTAVWISFGLGVMSLIALSVGLILALAFPCGALYRCLCRHGRCLLVGSMGTIVCALAALAIVLLAHRILTAILVALGAFFTAMMLIALFSVLLCLLCCLCDGRR